MIKKLEKTITVYVTPGGQEFSTLEQAQDHMFEIRMNIVKEKLKKFLIKRIKKENSSHDPKGLLYESLMSYIMRIQYGKNNLDDIIEVLNEHVLST